jgi:hypothetical protein
MWEPSAVHRFMLPNQADACRSIISGERVANPRRQRRHPTDLTVGCFPVREQAAGVQSLFRWLGNSPARRLPALNVATGLSSSSTTPVLTVDVTVGAREQEPISTGVVPRN